MAPLRGPLRPPLRVPFWTDFDFQVGAPLEVIFDKPLLGIFLPSPSFFGVRFPCGLLFKLLCLWVGYSLLNHGGTHVLYWHHLASASFSRSLGRFIFGARLLFSADKIWVEYYSDPGVAIVLYPNFWGLGRQNLGRVQ